MTKAQLLAMAESYRVNCDGTIAVADATKGKAGTELKKIAMILNAHAEAYEAAAEVTEG